MFSFLKKQQKCPSIFDHLREGLASPLNDEKQPEKRLSDQMLKVAAAIRGNNPPAIFLHGVLPRSGTVYFGEILRLHHKIFAYPNEIWELPFLTHSGDIINFQEKFFQTYQQNSNRMEQNDMLCLYGAGMMNYLHSFVPEGKTLLIKVPWMQFLNYFFTFFPKENLLLLVRDGRDTVCSTIRTWPNRDFKDVCRLWDASARIFLDLQERFNSREYRVCFVKFEDLLQDPTVVARKVLESFGLGWTNFPVDKISTLPVRGSSSLQPPGKVSWSPVKENKKFRPGGEWHTWSKKEKNIFKDICGDTLIKLGYAEGMGW